MANNKIRVALVQGDTNEEGYGLLLHTFAEPEILELFSPVIYCSRETETYLKEALQIPCKFNATDKSDEVFDHALADGREGLYDVLVCCPGSNGDFRIKDSQPLYVNDIIRMAFVCDGETKDLADSLSKESLINKVKTLQSTLRRDFRLSNPRIAILALNKSVGDEENNVIAPAISELADTSIQAFGPYLADDFFESRKYETFDAVIAISHDKGMSAIKMISDESFVIELSNAPVVCTMPYPDSQELQNAIFMAIDVFRHRKEYDEALVNPLPKLYHDRPDSGEKLRFSIPKKREE